MLVGTATAFAYLLALHRVPELLAAAMLGLSGDPIVLMLMINAALLMLGCIMDMAALILITTPIFLPVATEIGLDPVQFGMVVMMNLGLGLTTPPVGAVLFVGCAIARANRGGDGHDLAVLRGDPPRARAHHLLAAAFAHPAAAPHRLWRVTSHR